MKQECEEIGKLLGAMIAKAGEFCQTCTVREEQLQYQIDELEV